MAGDIQRRKGRKQEMRALALLREKGLTTQQLADAMGLKRSAAAVYVVRLRAEPRRVYVDGHEPKLGTGGSPAPIWRAGTLPDVEYVPQEIPVPKISMDARCARALELLAAEPASARQLAARMHVVVGTAGRYITKLRRAEQRQVYILKWLHPREVDPTKEDGGDWAPVYAVGSKPDKPKPKQQTSAERHKARQKDPVYRKERREAEKARRKRRDMVKAHISAGPQGIFAALGV